MLNKVDPIMDEVNSFNSSDPNEIEAFRIKMLGKKGLITGLLAEFRNVPIEHKKEFGQKINVLKKATQDKVIDLKASIGNSKSTKGDLDLSMSGEPFELGSRHPLSIVRKDILDVFTRIGFSISEGPEIEDDFHNFTALNFPEEHPARDMQDTFFIDKDIALRTHTSSVQVRVMEESEATNSNYFTRESV